MKTWGSSDTLLETRCFYLQPYINRVPVRAGQRERERNWLSNQSHLKQWLGRDKKWPMCHPSYCQREYWIQQRTPTEINAILLKVMFSFLAVDFIFCFCVESFPAFVHTGAVLTRSEKQNVIWGINFFMVGERLREGYDVYCGRPGLSLKNKTKNKQTYFNKSNIFYSMHQIQIHTLCKTRARLILSEITTG